MAIVVTGRPAKDGGSGSLGNERRGRLFLLFDFFRLLDYALAALETIRGDAMTQVGLTRLRIRRERRLREPVVRTMHAAP